MNSRRFVILLAPVLAAGLVASARALAAPLADLDAIVAKEMEVWKVPGLAIAVVKDGKVLVAKGYGLRDLEKKLPVTTKTRFAIASDTKSFTAASVALMVDDGKLAWDKPVRSYLPEFKLFDPLASERITPRDLLCHDSGLPRHDFVWYGAKLTRADIVRRLRFLEPSKDFRSTWQYQNMMFVTAGFLAGHVAGESWEALVSTRLFAPLEMTRSNFTPGALDPKDDDFSLPYVKGENEVVRPVPFYLDTEMGPAGSIYSTIDDLSHWAMMKLANGKFGDKQVLTAAQVALMQTPQMVVGGERRDPEIGDIQYGLGVEITSYRGHRLVFHGGNIDGFASWVTHMPDDNLAVVVLTNLGQTPARYVLPRMIYDRLLGLAPIDWSGRFREREAKRKASEADAKKQNLTPRKTGTTPSHPLTAYPGEFEHPAYGTVTIRPAGSELQVEFHGFKMPLKHFHYDVFETARDDVNPLEKTKFMFHTNWNGEVARLSVTLEPEVADIVFARKPDTAMRQKTFLEPLAGQYELGPSTVTITLRGTDTLMLSLPGQSTYELVPVRGTSFDIKGLSGFSVEFQRGADGAVTAMAFYQPNGNFVAKRKP
jgi:CubicO group peptidase (beta-lactamase class C family)